MSKPAQNQLIVSDVAAWRSWLDKHENESDGVWLVLAKKGTISPTSLSYAQALEEALCSGWIDGQRNSLNETTFLQRFTPRRKGSMWSQRNVGFIEKLTSEGRMRARGESEVLTAQEDGRWARAYPGSAGLIVPADLIEALKKSPKAETQFNLLISANRYSFLLPIITATEESRGAKIAKLITKLEKQSDDIESDETA